MTAWHLNLQMSFLSKILVQFRTTFWSWMLRIKTISKKPHPLESLPWVCETGPIWPEQSYGVTLHWLSMSTQWWLFNPIQSILITIPIMTTKIVTTKKNLNLTQHLSPKLAIPGPCRMVWGTFFPCTNGQFLVLGGARMNLILSNGLAKHGHVSEWKTKQNNDRTWVLKKCVTL